MGEVREAPPASFYSGVPAFAGMTGFDICAQSQRDAALPAVVEPQSQHEDGEADPDPRIGRLAEDENGPQHRRRRRYVDGLDRVDGTLLANEGEEGDAL